MNSYLLNIEIVKKYLPALIVKFIENKIMNINF